MLSSGYAEDEIKYFRDEHPKVADQCRQMIRVWLDEDADSSLEDLAYTMEGLKMIAGAKYLKSILEPVDKMEDVSE